MKFFVKYFIITFSSILLFSCSVGFGGLVALDESYNSNSKEIAKNDFTNLKSGDEIILELSDSSEVCGIYQDSKGNNFNNDNSFFISLLEENGQLRTIDTNEIKVCKLVEKWTKIWEAISIGAIIDFIVIYTIARNNNGF